MRSFLPCLLLPLFLASAALGQSPQVPVLHSENSYGFSVNDDKNLTYDTQYTRYTPIIGWFAESAPRAGESSSVLEESFHSHDHGGECCKTKLSVRRLEFVVGKDKEYQAVWKIHDVLGDEGEIVAPFYRVLLYGCCGDNNTFKYFRLDTGQALYESVVPLLKFEVPNTRGEWDRYVSAHEVADKKRNVAVLEYGTREQVLHTYWLEFPEDAYQLDAIRFDVEKRKGLDLWTPRCANQEPHLEIWSQDPDPVAGFALQVVFRGAPPVSIPVEHDQFAIARVHLPEGYTLREIARTR